MTAAKFGEPTAGPEEASSIRQPGSPERSTAYDFKSAGRCPPVSATPKDGRPVLGAGLAEGGSIPQPTRAQAAAPKRRRRKPRRAAELGIDDDLYDMLLASQDGTCAIRGCTRTPKTRRFHVDHDHATGNVRGLLCHWHNRIMPRDSREAYALAAYLEEAESL